MKDFQRMKDFCAQAAGTLPHLDLNTLHLARCWTLRVLPPPLDGRSCLLQTIKISNISAEVCSLKAQTVNHDHIAENVLHTIKMKINLRSR